MIVTRTLQRHETTQPSCHRRSLMQSPTTVAAHNNTERNIQP